MSYEKAYLGKNYGSLDIGNRISSYSNIILNFRSDSEEVVSVRYPIVEVPGDTYEIELPCVTNSQHALQMAQNILSRINQYSLNPYKVTEGYIDPAVELGDGITVDGLYSTIGELQYGFDPLSTASIGSFIQNDEIEDEFQFESSSLKRIERVIAKTSASFRIDIDRIIAQVTDEHGNYTALTLKSDGLHIGNAQGTVTIGSGSISIPNGSISFGDGTLNGALQAAYNHTGGGDPNPSYIHSTYISRTNVISPGVWGGQLWATGQGDQYGSEPAFYLADGWNNSNTNPSATPLGWLCYDKHGPVGDPTQAHLRVFLHSEDGVAMKLEAGGNMSLEANDSIYFLSYLKLRNGINYGTTAQRDAITPENGQIFWVVS